MVSDTWPSVVWPLGHRLRRWPNCQTPLGIHPCLNHSAHNHKYCGCSSVCSMFPTWRATLAQRWCNARYAGSTFTQSYPSIGLGPLRLYFMGVRLLIWGLLLTGILTSIAFGKYSEGQLLLLSIGHCVGWWWWWGGGGFLWWIEHGTLHGASAEKIFTISLRQKSFDWHSRQRSITLIAIHHF